MIVSIESSLPTFKSLHFHPGLNVLLSSKAKDTQDRRTRNSAGKSSFVELIQFLLGAKCDPDSLFRNPALVQHSFRGSFRIGGQEVTVERGGSNHGRVILNKGVADRLGLATKVDKASGVASASNADWNEFLGHAMFGLPVRLKGSAYDESFTPGFRPMFSYFARRSGSGSFISPERQAEQQRRWDWQVNLSYLLGLDWRAPFDLQKVRERERVLDELKKASKGGALGHLIGTAAELRPLVVVAEDHAARLRGRLERFEVVESYKELAAEAANAKAEMQAIARRAVSLRETLAHLRGAIEQEHSAPTGDLRRLYASVGVELPGVATRRFEDVERFHQSVLANRRAYLAEEIGWTEAELQSGAERSARLESDRSRILGLFHSGGALDDFVDLQRLLAEAEAQAASLRERLKAAEALEKDTTQLDIDRANIKLRLIEGLRGRTSHIEEAMLLIGGAIEGLYDDRAGKFEVEATDNGPEFRISIQGDRGTGISNMEIFCLDYALFSIWTKRGRGPGFLIHDSNLFDGVDERQVTQAMKLGKAAADAHSGQYIVCMNSDVFDSLALDPEIDRAQAVLKPTLSDAEDGGLFGLRFD
ncbi:ABC-three component system protein [Azospirillum aestuarii]|uniref:ABC-three component system protein n=1 Tax=Azospirillum aestuarii TaxID=2802052 RepID=UPI00405525FA